MSEYEIMDLMNNIEYGWLDKFNVKHSKVDNDFSDNYILQSPQEVIENKTGVCWDQVELQRYYFNNWNIKTYFLVHYDNANCPTHTFLTFDKGNKVYWFEHSWEKHRGIHEYNSIKKLLFDVRDKFIKDELNHKFNKQNLVLREYRQPKSHITVQEFYSHCENGKDIDLDNLK